MEKSADTNSLSDRKHYVEFDDEKTCWATVNPGVAQLTRLGMIVIILSCSKRLFDDGTYSFLRRFACFQFSTLKTLEFFGSKFFDKQTISTVSWNYV